MTDVKVLFEGDVIEIRGETFHHHPNGEGLVAKDARVAATAYVGPEVIVSGRAQVLDRVRFEGSVRVSGDAVLQDDVCARDHVSFAGKSRVSQNAKFSDDVRVLGNSENQRRCVGFWEHSHQREDKRIWRGPPERPQAVAQR